LAAQSAGQSSDTATSEHLPPLLIFPKTHHHFGHKIAAGITVTAICPGYIGTEMVLAVPEKVLNERIIQQIPVGRLGEPEEIARCVTFLVSD
ncbi:SDR family oxidoreductase, partial [Rhizobium ruizarguesonis]